MEKELHKIDILPARFIEKKDDERYVIRILIDGKILQDRIFDKWALEGIKNPDYLFVGIMTGVGFMQCTVYDASEFEKYFKTKWKILTK